LKPSSLFLLLAAALLACAGCSSGSAAKPHELTAQEQHGQRIFAGTCATCHRTDSTEPLNGPGLKGLYQKQYLPSGLKLSDQQVRETILHGRKMMPPVGGLMSDEQLNDVIAYLKTL
jgi:mono/diheme cytochrome c family protein